MSTPPTTAPDADAYRQELVDLLGPAGVITSGNRITKYLRDFSWFSPVLDNAFSDTTVEVVALPKSLDQLREIVALAARHRAPLTMRGSGTGNYGQSLPLQQGIVVDVRGVHGVLEVQEGRIAVLPGTIMKDVEAAARATGQEVAVIPSSFRVATASGYISGGSGGIGGTAHGDLWNGNVLAVELLTVEEKPRTVRLVGDEVHSILHMYGTIGVLTKVEFRLVPAHSYADYIVVFDEFEDALRFGFAAAQDPDLHVRLASAHAAPLGATMEPISDQLTADQHATLVWVDDRQIPQLDELARAFGGVAKPWPANAKDVSQFVYSHAIIWNRRAYPGSSWLQCEYARGDIDRVVEQSKLVQQRYPGVFLEHIEFVASPEGMRSMGIPAIVDLPDHEQALDDLLDFCAEIGIRALNPHSFVVEEGGFVGDTSHMLALKSHSDPHGILNPGKLGGSFFDSREVLSDVAQFEVLAPEQLEG